MTKISRKTDQSAAPALVAGQVLQLPIESICPDTNQPRAEFDKAKLNELAMDIQVRGIELPIVIRSDYVIKDGERRWRAAKIAGLQTVPCLLAEALPDGASAIDWQLDQVADNHHREALSALDWARFFRRLVDQGTPVGEIPVLLAARGITMSRPYVSNLMRLVELPGWAQDLIATGKLRPADGKYLLMALPHQPAMEKLRADLQRETGRLKENERIDFNHWRIRNAYSETAIWLSNSYGSGAPRFQWSTSCKGCEKRQQIEREHFCLDKSCYGKKQADADTKKEETDQKHSRVDKSSSKPKKPQGPTKVTPDEHGVVNAGRLGKDKCHYLDDYDVRFLPAMSCTGCEHNKPAIQSKNDAPRACCFNIHCFNEKQRNGNRTEGIAQWLDQRVLAALIDELKNDEDLQVNLIIWMALHGPTQNDKEDRVGEKLRGEAKLVRRALQLTTTGAIVRDQEPSSWWLPIATAGAKALLADRGNLYALARYAGVKLTAEIASMDANYLALKRKPELLDLARLSGMSADAADLAKKKVDEILAFVSSAPVVKAIGVPPDAKALFEQLQPVIDPEYLDDDDALYETEPQEDAPADDADDVE